MSDVAYSPEQLLSMNESGGLSIRRIADVTGLGRDKVHRMILAALASRTQAKVESVATAEVGSMEDVVSIEVEPAQLPLVPTEDVVLEPGQTVSTDNAHRLYFKATSHGRPATIVHIAEVFRVFDGINSSRGFTLPSGLNSRGAVVLPTIRFGSATTSPAVHEGRMTIEEAERLDTERIERRMDACFQVLEHLAAIGKIVPNPHENHLWPIRVTYANGETGEEEAVAFLEEGVHSGELRAIIHGSMHDLRKAAANRPLDPGVKVSDITVMQRQRPSDVQGVGSPHGNVSP